jgi:hypothetical protein
MRQLKKAGFLTIAVFLTFFSACGGGSNSASPTDLPRISISPTKPSVEVGKPITFTVLPQNSVFSFTSPAASGCVKNGNSITCTPTAVGEYTITVTAESGATGSDSTTLTANVYSISASPLTSFGSLNAPYAQPAAQTVTITNTGTASVALTQPSADNYVIGALSKTTLGAKGDTSTFTVRPKMDLPGGNYDETITISGTNGASATVDASFRVTMNSIATGTRHTIALKADGSIWAWGYNGHGQLGDGTTNFNSNPPVHVGTGNDWSAISAGQYHTIALKTDGSLWAWGSNVYGQLGNGTNTNSNAPVRVGTATDYWVAISAGLRHTIALKIDGSIWAWGYNGGGQLGRRRVA